MRWEPRHLAWAAVATGAGLLASAAVRSGLGHGWRQIQGEPPPDDAAAPEIGWRDALLWTAATSLAIGLARLAAERGAAIAYERVTGSPPPRD
jgi:hypothetical protein